MRRKGDKTLSERTGLNTQNYVGRLSIHALGAEEAYPCQLSRGASESNGIMSRETATVVAKSRKRCSVAEFSIIYQQNG